MKLTQYIASAVAIAGLVFASSCTDSVKYTPTADYEGDGVYFSNEAETNISIPENATSATLYINRVKTGNELTVTLTSTITDIDELPVEGIFTVPSTVTFAAGEAVAAINVAIDFSQVVPGDDYYITVATDTQTCDYGANSATFTLWYSPWKEPVRFSDDPVTVTYTWPFNSDLTFPQYLYVADNVANDNLKRYTIPTPYAALIPFNFEYEIDYSQSVEIDGDECYYVTTDPIPFYEADPEGLCTIMDIYSWFVMGWTEMYGADGFTPQEVIAKMNELGFKRSVFNTRTGIVTLEIIGYPAADEWGYRYNGTPFVYTVELPGYNNYAFNYSVQGNFVDPTGAESVVVEVFKSSNMAYFSAISKPGALTEEEVAAAADEIAADEDKQFYSEASASIVVPVDEEGPYTLVTVGYDEGYNPVYTDSYTFEFQTVQASSEWEKFGEADYTESFLCSIFDVMPLTYPVQVERHKTNPALYRLVNPYADWSKYSGYFSAMAPGNHYLYLDATDPNYVDIPESDLGIALVEQYGYLSCISQANIIIDAGNATKEMLQQYGYYGILEDGVITFPAGVIIGALSNYNKGEWSFYLNLDPDNQTDANGGKFDPYWGEGVFEVAIYNLMDAAGAPAKRNAPAAVAAKGAVSSSIATSFDLGKRSARKVRIMTKEEKAKRTSMEISKTRLTR